MKKISILFLILSLSLLGFIAGCGKDDDEGGTTDPSINPNDYNYYVVVSGSVGEDNYIINITPMANNLIIQTLELTVNDSAVTMTNFLSMWTGYCTMSEGASYQLDIILNGIDYSFNINIPYTPAVMWPDEWIITESTNITWNLTSNAEYQDIYASANDGVIYEAQYADLNASDRSFTVPANWVSSTLTEYNLLLMEMNFSFDNDMIVSCMAANEHDYYPAPEIRYNDKIKISKEIFNKFVIKE
ncbi:MAG: hypothetical protein P9L97_08230 [Candidatus Tenebribacter davisii]|jgi:hypothetical protein|nr:hypothetical protein [Candidatus Tenebribacter davisii]